MYDLKELPLTAFCSISSSDSFRGHIQQASLQLLSSNRAVMLAQIPTLSLTQGLASPGLQLVFLLCPVHENVYLVLEPRSTFQFSLLCCVHHCCVSSKEHHSAVNSRHRIALEDL